MHHLSKLTFLRTALLILIFAAMGSADAAAATRSRKLDERIRRVQQEYREVYATQTNRTLRLFDPAFDFATYSSSTPGAPGAFGSRFTNLFAVAAESCAAPSFAAATNFTVGANPQSLALGDFNADGKQDAAIANRNADTVTVLFGDGAGNFASGATYNVGTSPLFIVAADLNADGRLDLATANNLSDDVSILINNGTGGFIAASGFAAGAQPHSLRAGEFTGDAHQDLIVANNSATGASVLQGDGAGNFAAPASVTRGTTTRSAVARDFNGDDMIDLAVIDPFAARISVRLGETGGDFGEAFHFNVGAVPSQIVAGDLNSDGAIDLIVANSNSNNISVLLNTCAAATTFVDLAIAKTHTGNFTVGTNNAYTLSVSNVGTDATSGTITVADTLPEGLSFVSATGTNWTCSATGQDVTCTRAAPLAAAASTSITLNVAIGAAAAPGVTNTATVTVAGDTNGANNTASDPTTIVTPANNPPTANALAVTTNKNTPVAIQLTASDPENQPLTYTVVAQPTNGTLTGTAPNLTYTPAANFSGADSFTFKANDGQNDSNTATVQITVNQNFDLVITGGDSPDPVVVGNDLTYTFTITNAGPGAASGVTFDDVLPASAAYVWAASSAGTCSGSTSINCQIGTLASGASAIITVVVRPTTGGTLTNTATVAASEADSNAANNSATLTTTVTSFDACAVPNFAATTNYGVGSTPRSIAVADFNSDGRPDIVSANSGTTSTSTLR